MQWRKSRLGKSDVFFRKWALENPGILFRFFSADLSNTVGQAVVPGGWGGCVCSHHRSGSLFLYDRTFPENAETLFAKAEKDVKERYEFYKKMAAE